MRPPAYVAEPRRGPSARMGERRLLVELGPVKAELSSATHGFVEGRLGRGACVEACRRALGRFVRAVEDEDRIPDGPYGKSSGGEG